MIKLVKEDDAAKMLGLAVQTLRNWRHLGKGPNYVRLGERSIRYPEDELKTWTQKRFIRPEEQT